MSNTNAPALRMLLFMSVALAALFFAPAHAECGTIIPNSGQCICDPDIQSCGAPNYLPLDAAGCNKIGNINSACCVVGLGGMGCGMNSYVCALMNGQNGWTSVYCPAFDNNSAACSIVGCTWVPHCDNGGHACGPSSEPPGAICCAWEGTTCWRDATSTYRCLDCIPNGSPEYCDGPSQSNCCSDWCNVTSHKCAAYPGPPVNGPPAKPATPVILPTLGKPPAGALVNEALACRQNCPPSPLPADPNGDTVTMSYRWNVRVGSQSATSPIATWQPANGFSCQANPSTCTIGNHLSLQSRACDSLGACNLSDLSQEANVVCSDPGQYCTSTSQCCQNSGSASCDGGTCTVAVAPPVTGSIKWEYFILALLAAILTLALAYMASYAFAIPSLRAIVQDELVQVLATGAMAFMLLGLQAMVDGNLTGMLVASNGAPAQTMLSAANGKLGELSANTAIALNNVLGAGDALGKEASRSVFCNFLGVGFSIVNCSPLNAFRGSLTLGAMSSGMALSDLFAQRYLVSMAQNLSFTLIIPLGLFLRCFKVSRGAGGALIAIGFGFYAVYPTMIVAGDNLLNKSAPALPSSDTVQVLGDKSCDPAETEVTVSLQQFDDYSKSLRSFDMNERLVYYVLVRVVFMSILNLIVTLGFIRAFAHILGSEIDVSSLARIS